MKRKLYNSFLLLGILIVAVSCLDCSSQPTEFSTKDILGEWKNEEKQKLTDKDIYHIEYLYFINDSVVDVQLSDTEGTRILSGRWEKSFTKQIKPFNITINSDIKVAFEMNKNESKVLLMDLKKKKDKLYLSNFVKKEW